MIPCVQRTLCCSAARGPPSLTRRATLPATFLRAAASGPGAGVFVNDVAEASPLRFQDAMHAANVCASARVIDPAEITDGARLEVSEALRSSWPSHQGESVGARDWTGREDPIRRTAVPCHPRTTSSSSAASLPSSRRRRACEARSCRHHSSTGCSSPTSPATVRTDMHEALYRDRKALQGSLPCSLLAYGSRAEEELGKLGSRPVHRPVPCEDHGSRGFTSSRVGFPSHDLLAPVGLWRGYASILEMAFCMPPGGRLNMEEGMATLL